MPCESSADDGQIICRPVLWRYFRIVKPKINPVWLISFFILRFFLALFFISCLFGLGRFIIYAKWRTNFEWLTFSLDCKFCHFFPRLNRAFSGPTKILPYQKVIWLIVFYFNKWEVSLVTWLNLFRFFKMGHITFFFKKRDETLNVQRCMSIDWKFYYEVFFSYFHCFGKPFKPHQKGFKNCFLQFG